MINIFESLGLDLDTGISENMITVEEVESASGKRIVGNGCTIRRDNKPWNMFRMEHVKEGARVVGFKFSGYRSIGDEMESLSSQIEASLRRANQTQKRVQARIKELSSLSADLNKPLYNKDCL